MTRSIPTAAASAPSCAHVASSEPANREALAAPASSSHRPRARGAFAAVATALFGLVSVAVIGLTPTACQSGGIGDPCIPEDEYNGQFSGFTVTQEFIESRSFQCQTRICLVNHFQGRVSCPLGQQAPEFCQGDGDCAGEGEKCSTSSTIAPACNPASADKGHGECAAFGGSCDPTGKFCTCQQAQDCPENFTCECNNAACSAKVCTARVCHKPGSCQVPAGTGAEGDNKGKDCCVPGTDTPIAEPVCGQCTKDSPRDAEDSVYCTCRCGVAEGEPEDPDFNFCDCPDNFSCTEIRKNVGLGDKQITGKYCIRDKTKFESDIQCSKLQGESPPEAECKGIAGL